MRAALGHLRVGDDRQFHRPGFFEPGHGLLHVAGGVAVQAGLDLCVEFPHRFEDRSEFGEHAKLVGLLAHLHRRIGRRFGGVIGFFVWTVFHDAAV